MKSGLLNCFVVHFKDGFAGHINASNYSISTKGGEQMKYFSTLLVVIIAVVFVGSAMAVPSGKSVTFPDGAMGKVVFDGKVHADKGLKCMDCHSKIFPMKGPGKEGAAAFKMADINAGKFCGACHDGAKGFKASDPANCSKCHKK